MKRIVNLILPKIENKFLEEYNKRLLKLAKESEFFSSCKFCGHPQIKGRICTNCDYELPQYPLTSKPTIQMEIEE